MQPCAGEGRGEEARGEDGVAEAEEIAGAGEHAAGAGCYVSTQHTFSSGLALETEMMVKVRQRGDSTHGS